jgi:hypothetical protein
MTKPAFDRRDSGMSDWLRTNRKLDSCVENLDITDIDYAVHKFKSYVDNQGTRDVKLMLDLEAKTWGKYPNINQIETLYFRHQLLSKKKKLLSTLSNDNKTVWHFGQCFLVIHGGERPNVCSNMEWGVFDNSGKIVYQPINEDQLTEVLSFRLRPDNLEILTLRRHHLVREFGYIDRSPENLFPRVKTLIVRS